MSRFLVHVNRNKWFRRDYVACVSAPSAVAALSVAGKLRRFREVSGGKVLSVSATRLADDDLLDLRPLPETLSRCRAG